MSDIMRPLSFSELMDWARAEYAQERKIFGLSEDLFFRPAAGNKGCRSAFGDTLTVPIGPAAGPHSQLAQNILVSYLAGARFIELKTVQKMDGAELRHCVAKPCIVAEDEAYNCEWSTELTVEEAFAEYVKAWFAIKIFAQELQISSGNDFAFNMSVGYDLEGIKSAKIDRFIEGMKRARQTEPYIECLNYIAAHVSGWRYFCPSSLYHLKDETASCISHSITLSTLHGCPPQEIERIASYLITAKGLDTFIKCNPTLLGYQRARQLLNQLGYSYISFGAKHFQEDMQYEDCLAMIRRLQPLAAKHELAFGLKLTNTFPVDVKRGELPSEEMYMSGRSLHVLSLSLAALLSQEFAGQLPLSFSGGADAANIGQLLALGVGPVTMATTLLKPAGYARFKQIACEAEKTQRDFTSLDSAGLTALVATVLADKRYHKSYREKVGSRKTKSPLPLFDCYKAPCQDGGCPLAQQIPEYLKLVSEGQYAEAFRVIYRDNTAPSITGRLCPQPCREHCTRLDYEQSLNMRRLKLNAAEQAESQFCATLKPSPLLTKEQALIIGAGPAGIAAAIFLRRNGLEVLVREKSAQPYGVVRQVIPAFRISASEIERDYQLALAEGVRFEFEVAEQIDLDKESKKYKYIILALGAHAPGISPVRSGNEHIQDAFRFLQEARSSGRCNLRGRVAVVGGGDVAMDCARLALRCLQVSSVDLVYRRTQDFMPATQEELAEALNEGVGLQELLQPLSYDGQTLEVEVMELAEWDAEGRRSVVGTGQKQKLVYDHVIGATGARIDGSLYVNLGLHVDARGYARLDDNYESSRSGVFVIGDGRQGPATIVQAIADAKVVARSILERSGLTADFRQSESKTRSLSLNAESERAIYSKRAALLEALPDKQEGARCLACDLICEICTEVCPNRANLAVALPGKQNPRQIVHLDRLCNECGNCAVFCPHAGKPYQDKLTLFATAADFAESTNPGWLPQKEGSWLCRSKTGVVQTLSTEQLPADERLLLAAIGRGLLPHLEG